MKVFVTGTYRSGTTLLAYMLDAAGLPTKEETVNFMRFCYRRYGQEGADRAGAERMLADLNARLAERFGLAVDEAAFAAGLDTQSAGRYSYGFLYGLVMRIFSGSENWGEKTVLQWRNTEALLDMFEDMRVVHLVRDPRDVLSSWRKYTIAPKTDYLDAIGNCYDSMLHALHSQERFKDRCRVLRFEDLVEDPERESRELCGFLGLEFTPAMLEVGSFRSKFADKSWDPNLQSSFGEKLQGISRTPVGRWVKVLDRADVMLCEMATGVLMERFGYAQSGERWDLGDFFAAQEALAQSPLALNSLTAIHRLGEGVMRHPLNPLDPKTWGKVEQ